MTKSDLRTTVRQLFGSRRQGWALALAVTLAGNGAMVTGASAAPGVDPSVAFVRTEASRVVALLDNVKLDAAARRAKFKAVVLDAFDVPGIARYVCGSYWEQASAAEQARFLPVFKEALVKTYVDRFSDYSGEKVEVTTAKVSGDIVIVTTSATGASSRDVRYIDWDVLSAGKAPKLFDVSLDGVSTTQTMQDDYMSVLSQNDGKLDILTEKLKILVGR